jgi:vacuolar-type H+-ATPase subunit I/STV1
MMFLIHAAFALGLIALTMGSALYIWALRNHGTGSTVGRIVGFIVIVVSTLSLLCSLSMGLKIWKEMHLLNVLQMQSAMPNENAAHSPAANPPKEHHHRR